MNKMNDMNPTNFVTPVAVNEPVLEYSPGSPERKILKAAIAEARQMVKDIPMFIGGKEVRTANLGEIHPPHDIKHLLGHYHKGDASHVTMAIEAALKAKVEWANLSWESRASIFLKAANLLAGPYRAKINAATEVTKFVE
ncbi:MAG TPA: aldehyde dehydrogenase family protein, partial [Bacteroidales bacterium]|nr:aldehyde dehydrogenase family protein [Bacteroidales bacterium]